jgi:hypothetical protein
VKKTRVLFPLILCAATALGVGAVLAPRSALSQGAPPLTALPSPPPSVHADSDDLDAQLEAARRKLEEAAHQVAELSAQMS